MSRQEQIAEARTSAYAGDAEAAELLAILLPNELRGVEVADAYQNEMPPEAFRRLLDAVWNHDHHHLMLASKGGRLLGRWFNYAQFDVTHLPSEFTVYRGGVCHDKCEPWELAGGIAWTTSREAACWYALQYRAAQSQLDRPGSYPCVLQRKAKRGQVAAAIDARNEHEIILIGAAATYVGTLPEATALGEIDDGWRPTEALIAEWRDAAQRYTNEIAVHNSAC